MLMDATEMIAAMTVATHTACSARTRPNLSLNHAKAKEPKNPPAKNTPTIAGGQISLTLAQPARSPLPASTQHVWGPARPSQRQST